ncbi:Outer membrane protein OmpA and related peptidoglycan-associated (Lipo)proteins [Luteimonas sp. 9C]|uniref:OmpA family protein n=1 Tax=Luteimonas sp. 9C TaxID=2653148 RepID=UPI0012F10AA2|nr:OmpA family protein [Luteimonas sp. 9C]VXB00083.1 Outer membrane protein OmpA and related peptidoglycan-associated (Lipo)proteins [Luteimonas sp. 9C]
MRYSIDCSKAVRGALLAIAVAGALSACGTRHVSRDISPEGVAGEVVFPDASGAVLAEGTFPNVADLRNIGPGVTKDQLYKALGRPHFREGLVGVREWDYLFHFRTPEGVVTCQYKVIFDRAHLGQTFHWSPASCADRLADEADARSAEAGVRRVNLSADALFAFARHEARDIQPRGSELLTQLASEIREAGPSVVTVIGHTDRIGSADANQLLSQRRADTVRALLVSNGVPADAIVAVGKGEAEPVTTGCADTLARSALVECLAPDRRVDVEVRGVAAR